MRHRKDDNQDIIVSALRKLGATVQILAQVGEGCPDLLVGFRSHNYLFELKNPSQPKSKRELTKDEATWHQLWRGKAYIVETIEEILKVLECN